MTAAKESATGVDSATTAADVPETAVPHEAGSDAAPAASQAAITDELCAVAAPKVANTASVTGAVSTAVTSTATVCVAPSTSVAAEAVTTDVCVTVLDVGDGKTNDASSPADAVEPAADIIVEDIAILSQKTVDSAYVSAVTGTRFAKLSCNTVTYMFFRVFNCQMYWNCVVILAQPKGWSIFNTNTCFTQ